MSTPTQPRPDASARVVVPRPRPPMEASAIPVADSGRPAAPAPARPGMFERHAWLVPVCGIAMVIAAFTAMILLTWLAGGRIPFER
jgi:hypothetical protein